MYDGCTFDKYTIEGDAETDITKEIIEFDSWGIPSTIAPLV